MQQENKANVTSEQQHFQEEETVPKADNRSNMMRSEKKMTCNTDMTADCERIFMV